MIKLKKRNNKYKKYSYELNSPEWRGTLLATKQELLSLYKKIGKEIIKNKKK